MTEILNHFGTSVVKSITISGTTDVNGNKYDSRLNVHDHLIIGAYAKDMAVTAIYGGSLPHYNYHFSSYNNWNLQNASVNATIYYIDK